MTEKKEMLLIEKTQWEAIVSKVRDLTLKVSMLKDKCVTQPQYYNNKELCKVLGVEERLIQKYREQGLLAYSKIGDKYWYSQQDVFILSSFLVPQTYCQPTLHHPQHILGQREVRGG